jgi:hypothetical protein
VNPRFHKSLGSKHESFLPAVEHVIESTLGLESDGGSDDALDDEGAERRQIQ